MATRLVPVRCLVLMLLLTACSETAPEPVPTTSQEPVTLAVEHPAVGAVASMLDLYIDSERSFDSIAALFVFDDAELWIHWMQPGGSLLEQQVSGRDLSTILKERLAELKSRGVRCLYTEFGAEAEDDGLRVSATCNEQSTATTLTRSWLVQRDADTGQWKIKQGDLVLGGAPFVFPEVERITDVYHGPAGRPISEFEARRRRQLYEQSRGNDAKDWLDKHNREAAEAQARQREYQQQNPYPYGNPAARQQTTVPRPRRTPSERSSPNVLRGKAR